MTKDKSRKPPKRRVARERIDDELAQIALALDAGRLDKNAEGWFSIPWRDGWNACYLAKAVITKLERACPTRDYCAKMLEPFYVGLAHGSLSSDTYAMIGEVLERGSLHAIARAGLRCYQMLIARSDAGGAGYNAILRPAFEPLLPESVAEDVRYWRCLDALGETAPSFARVQAFNLAWGRGLFKAAYAL